MDLVSEPARLIGCLLFGGDIQIVANLDITASSDRRRGRSTDCPSGSAMISSRSLEIQEDCSECALGVICPAGLGNGAGLRIAASWLCRLAPDNTANRQLDKLTINRQISVHDKGGRTADIQDLSILPLKFRATSKFYIEILIARTEIVTCRVEIRYTVIGYMVALFKLVMTPARTQLQILTGVAMNGICQKDVC